MRPFCNAAAALCRRRPRPLSPAAPPMLLPSRRLLASSSSAGGDNNDDKPQEEEKHEDTNTNETAHFSVVAAEARSDPARRFRVSTDGKRRQKVPVFRDLTRNRESFRERTMEHDTFVTNLPRALQQYEEEQEMARKQGYARNPLVRDQATLVIDKGDASNRRWLSGAPEGAEQSSNWAEREAMAQKQRLSGVEGTIVRRRAGLAGAMAGDSGLPDEGLSVEEKIQLAMAQGDFDNLKGMGQPLERYNGGSSGSEGHYFEDRTSHRFMETLHRAGVKPVWVDKAGRIKQMHALLRRRVEAEWARLLLEQPSPTVPRTALPRLREQWRVRLECLKSLEEDLAFVNAEVDSYNLQVPSLSLQRVRLSLDFLLLGDHSASSLPPFFLLQQQHQQGSETEASSCTIDVNAAEACVRAAERDGILSPVTSLGWLRLEAVEDRVRQENARREKKGWSSSSSGSGTNEGGGEGGLFGSIAAWITSGGAGKTG